ncbi:hypothetical protein J4558_21835 [Leptolyngbya sp. 15MV]|nr:hypothetical protein J4558_21835 [Leptolyngbya sp. 15MV]
MAKPDRAALAARALGEIPGFMELGLWAAHDMYKEHGGAPAAGVVTGIGVVHDRRCMIIANDATVKAGAFFPMTCKKIIRAQIIAQMARMPLIYLVDSAGVFLPLQEDVFPDTDDFGRIFRNNAVISAEGIPQIAAIMGFCVAGGGYLPVLCDTLLMTEGSGLYLAGQALVKAAIGQDVTDEELGGAKMHAQISGTIDFREKDDEACLRRLRDLVSKYPPITTTPDASTRHPVDDPASLYDRFADKPGQQHDVRDLLACIVDARAARTPDGREALAPDFDEYKAEYGQSLVCGYARIGGHACGIVANQKMLVTRQMPGGKSGPTRATQMPGVIYDDSADKAARFIMDCNQRKIPLIFLHDTTGFMVGRDSEQGGIIRAGAKMVNAMSNCVVPKIVVILGASYGAGNYAMCGRAFDQFLSFAWPGSRCAVMGAAQASGTLAMIEEKARERKVARASAPRSTGADARAILGISLELGRIDIAQVDPQPAAIFGRHILAHLAREHEHGVDRPRRQRQRDPVAQPGRGKGGEADRLCARQRLDPGPPERLVAAHEAIRTRDIGQ